VGHLFDFTGKQCKIDLSALNGFGGCAKRVNGSNLHSRPSDSKAVECVILNPAIMMCPFSSYQLESSGLELEAG